MTSGAPDSCAGQIGCHATVARPSTRASIAAAQGRAAAGRRLLCRLVRGASRRARPAPCRQSYEAWSAYGCEVPVRINVDGRWQEVRAQRGCWPGGLARAWQREMTTGGWRASAQQTQHSHQTKPLLPGPATLLQVIQCYTPHLAGMQLFGADCTRCVAARAPARRRAVAMGRHCLLPRRPLPAHLSRVSSPFPHRRIPTSTSSAAVSSCCSEGEDECEGGEGGGGCADGCAASSACTSSTASTASTASDSDGEEACKDSPTAAAAAAARRLARGSVLRQQHGLGEPAQQPLFEFMEVERPHLRQPLHDKVMELAEARPELLTLDTRDLHPTSWLAVTWVPIYRCAACRAAARGSRGHGPLSVHGCLQQQRSPLS